MPDRIYDSALPYDLDLTCTLDGWAGTFGRLVHSAAEDIVSDGEYGPVEVTVFDGPSFTGTLEGVTTSSVTLRLSSERRQVVDINDISRFRA